MTDTATQSSGALPPETVAVLLESALRARKNGKPAAARALLRALSAQQPDLPQVWLALATVAETRVEQRRALEHVVALDPQNTLAQRGLARMGVVPPPIDISAPVESAPSPALPDQPSDHVHGNRTNGDAFLVSEVAPESIGVGLATPAAVETAPGPRLISVTPMPDQAARTLRWPLYLVLALAILIVLIAAFLIRGPDLLPNSQPVPTPSLAGAATALPAASALDAPTPALASEPSGVPASAATSAASAGAATIAPAAEVATVIPSPSPLPQPTPRQALVPGEVVTQGQWHAILIRPQDAVVLDGSIGALQPRGHFVLTLVAIGNDGQAPARLPNDLFALIDSTGQRYTPLPQASTVYLNSYGRGQHGDLSMEDMIPADGSNKSVPLIFDVPSTARNLYLLVGNSSKGWAIGQ